MKKTVIWIVSLLMLVGIISCTAFASDGESENADPFAAIGGWFADRGKEIGDVATAAGEGIADAATAVGEGITDAATAAGQGIADAATAAGQAITDATNVAGEEITNAALATGEWFDDRATEIQNAAIATADWTVYSVQNFDPSVFTDPEYYAHSFEKVALGDYSELDPTALSVGINIAASVANVDVAMDIRDLTYDIQHLQSGEVAPAALALDAVALVPVIGAVKYLKHVDTVVDAAKVAGTVAEAADAAHDVSKVVEVIDDVHDVAKAAEVIDDVHDVAKAAEVIDDVHDVAKAAEVLDDVHDVAKAADAVDDVHDAAKAVEAVDDVHDAAKAAEAADDVHDAAKAAEAVDDVHDAGKGAEAADDVHDATKAAEVADDAHDATKTTDAAADVVDEASDVAKKGGSYADVFNPGEGDLFEVHHMPANNATSLDFKEGPAIKMEKGDHFKTASRGSSNDAIIYRRKQKELIDQGHFREALQMDIDDIHEKFGDKYDDAIEELLKYVDQLEQEGKIVG